VKVVVNKERRGGEGCGVQSRSAQDAVETA